MPLPISRTAMDKLGVRLAASDEPADEDLALWRQVAGHCQRVLDGVQSQLEELGYEGPTPRVKTTGTLTDKLRRERPMRLSQVQDLAGARVIVAGRAQQDEAVASICELFVSQGHECKVSNRFDSPSHGYRAFHVLVSIDQVTVEIQVRTELQDTWAQIIEELADTWGRDIRYGGEPLNPESRIAVGTGSVTRSQALAVLKGLSDVIAKVEIGRAHIREFGLSLDEARLLLEDMTEEEAEHVPPSMGEAHERIAAEALSRDMTPLPPLPEDWPEATGARALEIIRDFVQWLRQMHDEMAERTRSSERALRDTLQLIARATEQEE